MFKTLDLLRLKGRASADNNADNKEKDVPEIVKKYRRVDLLKGRRDKFYSSGAMELDADNLFVEHEETHEAIAKLIKLGSH